MGDLKTVKTKKKMRAKPVVKKILIRSLIVFGVVFVLFFGVILLFAPRIELKGDSKYKVEYGNKYEEPGYKATYHGRVISNKVHIIGKVNEKKVGTYKLKYKIRKNLITITKKRIVEIIDIEKPKIELKGGNKVDVCPDKGYIEAGYIATDNYDGDITKNVKVEKKDKEVIYTVKDSSGNEKTVKRKLNDGDSTKPVLTLKGKDSVTIVVGNDYSEPGYTAVDNCDEDITKNVKVESTVDNKKAGTYKITYTAKDKAGNTEVKTRKVVVQQTYTRVGSSMGCGKAGVIYLTFDDGPNPTTTPTILNILKKYDVKATFFVVGGVASSNPGLLKREANEGHAIGIHTWTHDYSVIYSSSNNFWNEVNKTAKVIKDNTGQDSKLIRFPGGASNTISRHYSNGIMSRLSNEVMDKGYNYFDWNISSGDANATPISASTEISNVVNSLSKSRGNVILMHDIKTSTMNAIEGIVKYGKDNGYTFDVLDPSINCKQAVAN